MRHTASEKAIPWHRPTDSWHADPVTGRPSLSIVTMAWRNEQHAGPFMTSLAEAWSRAGGTSPQVIVVVNGEEGDAAAAVADQAAEVAGLDCTVVRLDMNTGFSGGANAGLRSATGEILVVANLDLMFDDRFLSVLGREAAGPAPWDLLAPRVLQGPSHKDSGVSRRTTSHRLRWVPDPPSHAALVASGNGACLVLRRATLDRRQAAVGALFDPEYHSFNEDIDIFWWAEKNGLVVRYVPDLEVSHALAGSFSGRHRFGERPPAVQQRVIANYRVTVWKNAAGLRGWLGWPLGEAVYAGQAVVFGKGAGIRAYAASWPESVRTAAAIRRRRGRLRPAGTSRE